MKITKIEKIEKESGIYIVTFKPNWLEKLFGFKENKKRFMKTWGTYTFGGGNVYVTEKGEKLENGNWIGESLDNWNRKF